MAWRDEKRDKASADLLRRTLASSEDVGAPGSQADDCPDPEVLAAYTERALDADETVRCELHFSICARCRDELAAMARAVAPAPRPPRISWIWTWGWIALAPVTAALLIAGIFIALRPNSNRATLEVHPLVAEQAPGEPPPNAAILEAPRTEPAAPAPSETRALDSTEQPAPARIEKRPAESRIQSNSEPEQPAMSPAPTDKAVTGSSVTELPLQSRHYTELQKLTKPVPPKPSTQTPGGGERFDVAQPRAQSETVTVQSEVATATTAAPVPHSLADNSDDKAGVAPAAVGKKSRPMMMAGSANAVATQMLVAQPPLDRSTRVLVLSPDPQVRWRISSGHYVEMSADAGATWRTQWTSPTAQVVAGSAPSTGVCWLVGNSGIVLLTSDANKWHTITPPVDADFTSVVATDASSATLSATDGRSFQTSDGGKHWTAVP
ncbi:MAG TPA: hypothetical protein VK757_01125 [Candidatus Acidoferrum sp.]|jgi:hypothetical protein|nr:hypothetical protein [Candidatus Acidoferrum sp.]